jgi:Zn-dependent protease
MLFTLSELLDVILMTLGVGYIFMDLFKVPRVTLFDWRAFGRSCLVTAPAIILHELGHKFVAVAFGADATFHAAYAFLALGLILKLFKSPIIFLVPAYVSFSATLTSGESALVAFAGPAINGVLYLSSLFALKQHLTPRGRAFWLMTRKLNGMLFIFNLLPLPGFDGFHLFRAVFGA